MRNIKALVAYDGTHYLGWQKTSQGRSIESVLQAILEQILQHAVVLQAASRTDAGVHARGQVINFRTSNIIDLKKLYISLCGLLPRDIAILSLEQCSESFHPTLDASGKEYHYTINSSRAQYPQDRHYAWHYPYELNLHLMDQAIPHLLGKRHFGAFCNVKKNEEYADFIREITNINTIKNDHTIIFKVSGKSFLYKMVRNLVGTLVYVGRGKLDVEELPQLMEKGDRRKTGITAPAHGLSLEKVYY